MDTGDAAGVFHLFHGGVFLCVKEVVEDCAVEQVGFLGHHADILPQPEKVHVPDVRSGHGNRTVQHVIQPGDQVDHRGFAGTGGPDNGVHFAAGHGKADIL